MFFYEYYQEEARKKIVELEGITRQERELLIDLVAINQSFLAFSDADQLLLSISEYMPAKLLVEYMRGTSQEKLRKMTYNSAVEKLQRHIEDHGADIVYNLGFRLAGWNPAFVEPVQSALRDASGYMLQQDVRQLSMDLKKLMQGSHLLVAKMNSFDQSVKSIAGATTLIANTVDKIRTIMLDRGQA